MGQTLSVVSVVLLPTEAESKQLCACSAALNEVAHSDLVLDGVTRLPHLTVVQFEMPVTDAEELWSQVQHLRGVATELLSECIAAAPNSAGDKLWVLLQFLRSTQLDTLQKQVMATDVAQRYPARTELGDAYNPHITLGRTAGSTLPPLDLAQFNLLRRKFAGFALAVGQNGDGVALTRVLYR